MRKDTGEEKSQQMLRVTIKCDVLTDNLDIMRERVRAKFQVI